MSGPLVILGFGRSGTTWLADIISKATGKLVLFEPMHPSVLDDCRDLAYRRILPGDPEAGRMVEFYRRTLNKDVKKPWLLRNHVPLPLKDIDPAFLDLVWRECEILGTKEIRANMIGPLLQQELSARLLFIIRDPRAVAASILKRTNFWEFGWPGTFELFLDNTVRSSRFAAHPIASLRKLAESCTSDLERIAVMWSLTHAIALPDMKTCGAAVVRYEDLYSDPFAVSRQVLNAVGLAGVSLHPAHIFTPSMTTMKTLHGLYEFDGQIDRHDLDFFWNEVLSPADARRVLQIAADFGVSEYG